MRAVVTRVKEASVTIENKETAAIGSGFLVLLGIGATDMESDAVYLADRICGLRIFADESGKMNLNLAQVGGELLVVSQFTLYANLKSRRPGFSQSAKPEMAKELYQKFLNACEQLGFCPKHGEFGADMEVASINDGPVTICFDTKMRE